MAKETTKLAILKQEALACAAELGLPNRRLENWHYTDLRKLLPPKSVDAPAGQLDIKDFFAALDPLRLIFVDGRLQHQEADLHAAGIKLHMLEDTDEIGTLKDYDTDGFLAANVAHFVDGVKICVSGHVERPLEIVWCGTANDKASYGRVVLQLEKDAQLTLLETHTGIGLCHVVNDVSLAQGAELHVIKTHLAEAYQAGISHTRMRLAESAKLYSVCLGLCAGLARHETDVIFAGKGAYADIASAILASGGQHMDITSCLDHQLADTHSKTMARSVLSEQARGVFQGKVIVRKDAQRVDAQQKSDALILSSEAEMNAKPELEIYADDVACAHGSTIGAIDREALFFLRSRGLGEAEASHLLIAGFLAEVVNHVSDVSIRDVLNRLVQEQLVQMEIAS